jgi:hypothetical protein
MRDRWRVWCGANAIRISLSLARSHPFGARADQNGLRADSAIRPGALLICMRCCCSARMPIDSSTRCTAHHTQQFVCREVLSASVQRTSRLSLACAQHLSLSILDED